MVKRILGVVAGIVVAGFTVFCVEWLGSQLYPEAASIASAEGLAVAPTGALLIVVLAWFLGAALGAAVAVRLSGYAWSAWLVAAFIVAGVVLNALSFPHPTWMVAAGILLPLLAAWLLSGRTALASA